MRFLIVDVGAGTMDILYYDSESGVHYKAVAKSPVLYIAEKAAALEGPILITGREMGGGPLASVLSARASANRVVMTASAAATIHHDPERVRSLGIEIVDDGEAELLEWDVKPGRLVTADLDLTRLESVVAGLGVPFSFDVAGICVQDHGLPPREVSHLDFRHKVFKGRLEKSPYPQALLFRDDEVPAEMTRLGSVAEDARKLPVNEIYVMDSGMAAILGATMDPRVKETEKAVVLDIATSHTVGAAMDGKEIAGFFEYHTRDIDLDRLEFLIEALAEGRLEHGTILEEGGHGAYVRKSIGFRSVEIILATGPKRGLIANARLPIIPGGPWGDNMMTGTVGVLEAIRRRKGLNPMDCL